MDNLAVASNAIVSFESFFLSFVWAQLIEPPDIFCYLSELGGVIFCGHELGDISCESAVIAPGLRDNDLILTVVFKAFLQRAEVSKHNTEIFKNSALIIY